jgi:hypothetical protein
MCFACTLQSICVILWFFFCVLLLLHLFFCLTVCDYSLDDAAAVAMPAAAPKPPRRQPRAPDASAHFPAAIKAALAARLTALLSSMEFTLLTDIYDVAPLVTLLVHHLPATAQAMANPDLHPPFPLAYHRLLTVCPAATFAVVFAAIADHSQQAVAANVVAALEVAAPVAAGAAAPAAAGPLAVDVARHGV